MSDPFGKLFRPIIFKEIMMIANPLKRAIFVGAAVAASMAFGSAAFAANDVIQLVLSSTDPSGSQPIEVLSLSGGVSIATGGGSAGAGAGAKPNFSNLSFTKHLDSVSPSLFVAAATGHHYASATFTFYHNRGGVQTKFFTIKLTNAVFVSDELSGAEIRPISSDLESDSFSYTSISLTDEVTGVTSGYDISQNVNS